jgi:hypothetical protein
MAAQYGVKCEFRLTSGKKCGQNAVPGDFFCMIHQKDDGPLGGLSKRPGRTSGWFRTGSSEKATKKAAKGAAKKKSTKKAAKKR